MTTNNDDAPTSIPPRPKLPTRSNSTRSHHDDPAPYDAAKSDDKAITDVYETVEATGSLEAAAKKLQQIAMTRAWEDDPEEAEYLAQNNNASQDEEAVEDEEEGGNGYGYEDDDDDMEAYNRARQQQQEVVHLQEIVPGLWVGDLVAAMDADGLRERGITNILSLLRPSLQFSPEFSVYPLEIDDSEDTDILEHLPSCVAWIHEALEKKQTKESGQPLPDDANKNRLISPKAAKTQAGSVLVHCQAGMSRSATVTAAYLMRVLDIGPVEAVEMIQEQRPVVSPSDTFWYQLGLFYNADGKVTLKDRSTRQFYMERATSQFMNGYGGAPAMDKMAKYPATPTMSRPATPMGARGRRKIRCKACRRQLALREHMMDHILDQSPESRPRTPSESSQPPSRMSFSHGAGFTSVDPSKDKDPQQALNRRPSIVSDVINPLTGLPGARSRRGSSTSFHPSPMTPFFEQSNPKSPATTSPGGLPYPKSQSNSVESPAPLDPKLSMTSTPETAPKDTSTTTESTSATATPGPGPAGAVAGAGRPLMTADQLAARLPPHLQALRTRKVSMSDLNSPFATSPVSSPERESPGPIPTKTENGGGTRSMSLNRKKSNTLTQTQAQAQSQGEGEALAGTTGLGAIGLGRSRSQSSGIKDRSGSLSNRRMSGLAMTPAEPRSRKGSLDWRPPTPSAGPPILVNPKCSGYFVEPLTWMEPVLCNGDVAGKIVCPNEKCGVKLGNFDWAGVQCGCKEWVTPGFCIARSKVDEVW